MSDALNCTADLGVWNSRTVTLYSSQLNPSSDVALNGRPFVAVLLFADASERDDDELIKSLKELLAAGCVYFVAQGSVGVDHLHAVLDRSALEWQERLNALSSSVIMTVVLESPIEAVKFGVWLAIPDRDVAEDVDNVVIWNLAGYPKEVLEDGLRAPG